MGYYKAPGLAASHTGLPVKHTQFDPGGHER